jgi:hypothetical protein
MKSTAFLSYAALLSMLATQGCSGAAAAGNSVPVAAAGSLPATLAATSRTVQSARSGTNLAALPLDDGHYTTAGPRTGWVYSCHSTFNGGGSRSDGPWINAAAGTWNSLEKIAVEGSVSWTSTLTSSLNGKTFTLDGNGLPAQPTGVFPISPSDPAYAYDHNPNTILAQNIAWNLPAHPKIAKQPSCLNMGPIGVMLTGAQLFDALDAMGRDAAAHEVLDSCDGHPQGNGIYHYHGPSPCMSDPGKGHSALLGYAADGFGIFGVRGQGGKILTDADLDACHGHTHAIWWHGKRVVMYHYHMTYEYPYSLGCYRGTPVAQPAPPGPP